MTRAQRQPHVARDVRDACVVRVAGGALLFATALLLATSHALAHDRSVSQSSVSVRGTTVSAQVRLRTVDLSALSTEVAAWAHDRAAGRDAASGARCPRHWWRRCTRTSASWTEAMSPACRVRRCA
ncbi:MAG: hypothetical protein IPN77_11130 [Sandaracinaceae bacterium]|nr:hypothetical protein [Sandaracinaceae bacterium]